MTIAQPSAPSRIAIAYAHQGFAPLLRAVSRNSEFLLAACHAESGTATDLRQSRNDFAPSSETVAKAEADIFLLGRDCTRAPDLLRAVFARNKPVFVECPALQRDGEANHFPFLHDSALQCRILINTPLRPHIARALAPNNTLGNLAVLRIAIHEPGFARQNSAINLAESHILVPHLMALNSHGTGVAHLAIQRRTSADGLTHVVLVIGRLNDGALFHIEATLSPGTDVPRHTLEASYAHGLIEYDSHSAPSLTLETIPSGSAALRELQSPHDTDTASWLTEIRHCLRGTPQQSFTIEDYLRAKSHLAPTP